MPKQITFTYLNHRGETSERTVEAHSVEYLVDPGYGYQPGWFISGEVEGKGRRSFSLSRIIFKDGEHMRRPVTLVRF